MTNEKRNGGFSDGSPNDGVQLQLCGKSSAWKGEGEAREQGYKRCSAIGGESTGGVAEEGEEEKYSVAECDGKCTDGDKLSGMFGYFCTRCGEHDLGSLNDH